MNYPTQFAVKAASEAQEASKLVSCVSNAECRIMEKYLMIKLRVLELLKKNGKTKYWLYKQLGMSYQNFNKMVNNETKSIRYENIETLCLLFNCTPNELFEITED